MTVIVEGPARAPLPYGLFSVVPLRPSGDERWLNGVEWERLEECASTHSAVYGWTCSDSDDLPDFSETTVGMGGMAEAALVNVMTAMKCSPVGLDQGQRAVEKVQQRLLLREESLVEEALWTGSGQFPGVPSVSPIGVSPSQALGTLEAWMRDTVGLGIIHVSRQGATRLIREGLISGNGSVMRTGLGTPVVVGAGYETNVYSETPPAPPAPVVSDNIDMIASGPMFAYRSEITTFSPFEQGTNDQYALAQRSYVVGFEECSLAGASFYPTDAAPPVPDDL